MAAKDNIYLTVAGYGTVAQAVTKALIKKNIDFRLIVRKGPSFDRALKDGLRPVQPEKAEKIEILYSLVPDHETGNLLKSLQHPPKILALASGAPIYYGIISGFPNTTILVAPKCSLLSRIEKNMPVPFAVAATPKEALATAEDLCKLIAGDLAVPIETDFKSETLADLLGEQLVLCGGFPMLVETCFQALTQRGVNPLNACLDLIYEMEIILDLLKKLGPAGLKQKISKTALLGSSRAQKLLEKKTIKNAVLESLEEIEQKGYLAELAGEKVLVSENKVETELKEALLKLKEMLK